MVTTNVVLPKWIWELATDQDHLKELVLSYMVRYPDYEVIEIKHQIAVCERGF